MVRLNTTTVFALLSLMLSPAFSFAETSTTSNPNIGVEAQVRSYFSDIPVMVAIAQCESSFRQFDVRGSVLLGGTGTMAGIFQFDENIHALRARAIGLDIDTTTGNLAYARYLYGSQATTPWFSSFSCWHPIVAAASSVASTTIIAGAFSSNLMIGNVDPEVVTLQRLLNAAGFTVASSGPGSIGNETTKFGLFTQAALHRFQCARAIACSGDEYTTGYGMLNGPTRVALLSYVGTSTAAVATTTPDESAQIAQLQSQIVALTALLQQLLAQRTSHL